MGLSPSSNFCDKTAPKALSDASVVIINGFLKSGNSRTSFEDKISFDSSKDFFASLPNLIANDLELCLVTLFYSHIPPLLKELPRVLLF